MTQTAKIGNNRILSAVLALIFIFLNGQASGQRGQDAGSVRRQVPGTWCSMVVDPDFVASRRFTGFENAASGSTIIISMLSSSYASNVKALDPEKFQKLGMKLTGSREVKLEKNNATYCTLKQTMKGVAYTKQMLMVGDSDRTISISGFCKDSDSLRFKSIERMLYSAIYDPADLSNLLDAVPFVLDSGGTGYIPARYSGGRLFYTLDGHLPTKLPGKAMFVATSDSLKLKDNDRQAFALSLLKNLPGVDTLINTVFEPLQLDNLKGFSVTAGGFFPGGKPQSLYAVYLDDEKHSYYMLTGIAATPAMDEQLPRFRKLAYSFKRK